MKLNKGSEVYDEKRESCINATCYTYAFNIYTNQRIYVGDLLYDKRLDTNVTDQVLVDTIMKEITIWGYKGSIVKDFLGKDFIVCLVRERGKGYYHFYRQIKENLWTHKKPMELPTSLDWRGEVIFDPSISAEPGYQVLSFFKLEK